MKTCPDCGATTLEPGDPDPVGFGTPVRLGGERHRSDCPTIPKPSPADLAKLQADLEEMDRCRRRAWAESANFWIG